MQGAIARRESRGRETRERDRGLFRALGRLFRAEHSNDPGSLLGPSLRGLPGKIDASQLKHKYWMFVFLLI